MAWFSGLALTEGIETHRIEHVDVRMYSAAKTVADCFKYRNTRLHRGGSTELARFARICRVTRVIQPYLDAIS